MKKWRFTIRTGAKTRWTSRILAVLAFVAALYFCLVLPGSSLWQRVQNWTAPWIARWRLSRTETDKSPEPPQENPEQPDRGKQWPLQVHFIDVGEGDSILIKCDGHAWLIDGGDSNRGGKVKQYLFDQGVSNFDAVVCSHEHGDHLGGFRDILPSVLFDRVFALPAVGPKPQFYRKVVSIAKEHGKPHGPPVWNRDYALGRAKIRFFEPIVAPKNGLPGQNVNNTSLVLRLQFGQHSFLFPGDIEEQVETLYVEKYGAALQSTVLKVAHHGAYGSTKMGFINCVRPKKAVISANEREARHKSPPQHHPNLGVLARLGSVDLYRTDIDGNIVFNSDGHNLVVETEK